MPYACIERTRAFPEAGIKGVHVITDEVVKTLDDLRRDARSGMTAAQAETPAPAESAEGSSPQAESENQTEGTTEEPKVETSPAQGGVVESKTDYWDQYKDEQERRKALNETKEYAAKLSRELQEIKAKPEATKTETKEERPEPEKETVEAPDVETFIDQAINLKTGHTEDQLRIAQINYEVLKFHKEVLNPRTEAASKAKAELDKTAEAIRDQRVIVNREKKKADANSLYVDDLKEAEAELRTLEKQHTDARLDHREASDALAEARNEERNRRLDGRKFALDAVENIKRQSRESKAQTERANAEKQQQEESNKAWQKEFDKALDTNGLKEVSEKHKAALHDLAYNHISRLSKSGQIKENADLQTLIKESFTPYLELKGTAPVMESRVERKKDLTDEPGPSERKAKSGEDKPKSLDDWRKNARRGMRAA